MKKISYLAQTFLILPMLLTLSLSVHAKQKSVIHRIQIEGMKFNPDHLTVNKGDTVIWVNQDIVPHTATAAQGQFNSGEIKAQTSWKYKALKTGEYPYACSFHPTMKAQLSVK